MPRLIDHLVICVHDLARAALDWQTLGFNLTPTGVHPFGTSNRLAMFGNNFLELLAVTDAAAVPPAAPGRFSFAAHNRDFLATAEGMSMLAMHSTDAHADAARFKADHIGAYAPFDFGRDAVLPGGGTARVEFSLAFATDPAMPGIAFFTCQQRHPPELFWKPDYQRHPNGALRVIEVVMSAPQPAEHRRFLEHFTESTAELAPGRLTIGESGNRITVLGPSEMARRLPGLASNTSPCFCAARLAVADLDATKRELKKNGVDFEVTGAVLLVPPAASHGLALEFVEQEQSDMAHIVSHNPASVHAPSSGYSMGLELGQHRRLLFVSGQVPENPDGSVPEGFEAQCEQAWRNVIAVLAAAGLGVEHLVKINTFLTDRSQVVANRAVRRKMLGENEPASTVMVAETVDGKWLLEIEAIAAE